MGRRKIESDDDRYLVQREGNFYYKRRIPMNVAKLDGRGTHARMALKTSDRKVARKQRDQLEAADNALWASMIVDGVTDPARRRYEAAVKQVEALGFSFNPAESLGDLSRKFDDMRRRLLEIEAGLERNHGVLSLIHI